MTIQKQSLTPYKKRSLPATADIRRRSHEKSKARQHPVKLFSYTTKYFWLLLFPLARSLYTIIFDPDAWAQWLEGAWFDILALLLIFLFAWVRWSTVYFEIKSDRITSTKGIIAKHTNTVLYSEISTLSITQGFLYRLLGACKVQIGTNGGFLDKADVTIVMKKSDADKLYDSVRFLKIKSLLYSVSPNRLRLWVFSLLFSSTLSGAVLAVATVLQTSKIVSQEIDEKFILDTITEAVNKVSLYLPPIAAGVAIFVGSAWLLSFISNIFSFWNHVITKSKDSIYIKSGLGVKNLHIISLKKVNAIELRQNLFSKLCRVSSMNLSVCGFGSKSRVESDVLLPITTNREIRGTIKEIFPEYPRPKIQLSFNKRASLGLFTLPLIYALVPPLILWVLYIFFPEWYIIAAPAVFYAELPAIWLAVVRAFSIFSTGIGFEKNYIVLKYSKLYSFRTVIAPKDKITKILIRQTPFQVASGNCTLKIYTASDSSRVHKIYGLRLDRTLNLLDQNGFDMYDYETPQG